MKRRYEFDIDSLDMKKERLTLRKSGLAVLSFVLLSLSLTIVFYLLFSLLFNTGTEAALKRQNKAYESQLSSLEEKSGMLSSEIRMLSERDDRIYREIFLTDAPKLDVSGSFQFPVGLDTILDRDMEKFTEHRIDSLSVRTVRVEENMKRALAAVSSESAVIPPMRTPIAPLSYAQIGASVGDKINPYYKVSTAHTGLDIISEADIPVTATADGTVTEVSRSMKGQGNVVEISHEGGYRTRYAHLSAINVRKGAKLRKGAVIGRVGISGNAYAPHLHYEVRRDTVVLNPVNHFFASVTPEEYYNMMTISTDTRQSMD